jgi:hypothetical protein
MIVAARWCPGQAPSLDSPPVLLITVKVSPRAARAWPLAWPSPSGPLGRQRSPALKGGSQRSFLRSGFGNGLRVPLTLEGADPDNARRSGSVTVPSSGDQRTWREGDCLAVVLAGAAAGYGGDRRRAGHRGMPRAAAAAP